MSEKDFDNQIRKKLDSVQSDYTPEAWEKFKKLMPVPWYVTFFKTYGGWIFGGISSLALLFNFLYNPKTRPFEETSTFKPEIVKEIETIHSVDTIYKTIYVPKYHDRIVYRDLPVSNSVEQTIAEESITKEQAAFAKTEKESLVDAKETLAKQDAVADEENVEGVETKKSNRAVIKDSLGVQVANKGAEKKNTFWRGLNIRPGVEVDYMGNNSFSFGPLVEVFLKNRFSVSTGVSISNSSPTAFKKTAEFNKMTGKDFEERYKPQTGPNPGPIKDITIETSRIRMPIYMSYYVPLSYKLDFLISTGTRLDLKVSESVSFTSDTFSGAPYKKFENGYKPNIFNNLYYGMGLQYRYNRISGQISPYFEFPFSKPTYVISNNKFGINAALKFSLK